MAVRVLAALDMDVDLASALRVEVPEVWLRADERMRELAYRIDSARTRRRIAEGLEREPVALEGMEGLELAGRIRPHGEGESLTVELTSANPSLECEDVLTFELVRNPRTLGYDVTGRSKLVRDVWGGGCVPPGLCVELLPAVGACEGVSRAAARFGEVVAPENVSWDWAPGWSYGEVALPEGQGTLADLVREKFAERGPPGFLALVTWSLPVEERPASSGGLRVRMVLDPEEHVLVSSWEEEWRVLY